MRKPRETRQSEDTGKDTRRSALDPGLGWAADAYLSFSDQRLRPALELLSRIPGSPRHVVDLGCGAGGPTRLLARRWPEARIVGLDHSGAMLDEARAAWRDAGEGGLGRVDVEWRQGDVAGWQPGAGDRDSDRDSDSDSDSDSDAPDLIFSNACLHWIDDHDELFPRLLSYLPPSGVLAVQMPLSWSQPSHRLMRDVLADLELADRVPSIDRRPVDEPEVYVRRLRPHAAHVDVWTTTYQQILDGEEPVYRFVESTGLRPVRSALGGSDWARFETEYRRRLSAAYPRERDGSTLFPFRRLFLVARVAG